MRRLAGFVLLCILTFFWSPWKGVCDETHPLFHIERSKNKNIVQYDFHPDEGGHADGRSPVEVYWILETGERRELNHVQRILAYGIASQRRVGKDEYEIVLTAFRERKITVKKTDEGYKAFAVIDGREGILEKIHVECKESLITLPKVLYADVYGSDQQTNLPLTERLFSK